MKSGSGERRSRGLGRSREEDNISNDAIVTIIVSSAGRDSDPDATCMKIGTRCYSEGIGGMVVADDDE